MTRAGTMPDPNVMQAPNIAMRFAADQNNSANQERASADRMRAAAMTPEYAGQVRSRQNEADENYGVDRMSLARQKTEGIMEREGARQQGANERANIRRYGSTGTIQRSGHDIVAYALSKGLQAPQAAALAAHMQKESSFNMNAVGDKNLVARDGPRGNAKYGYGFRLDRQEGIENYAAENKRNLNDPKTSVDYLLTELEGSHADKGGNDFFSASTPEAASMALSRAIGHSTTGQHAGEASARAKLSRQYAFKSTDDPSFRDDRRTTASLTPPNTPAEGVDPDGKKYKRMYLPRTEIGLLQSQGYDLKADMDLPQNARGQLAMKIYEPVPFSAKLKGKADVAVPPPVVSAPAVSSAPVPDAKPPKKLADVTGSVDTTNTDDDDEDED